MTSGRMRGGSTTDLKRYLRFLPSVVGTPGSPWEFISGYPAPWEGETGSGIPSAAIDIKDAQKFRGRAGESMTILGD